jgi:hypothetical protein
MATSLPCTSFQPWALVLHPFSPGHPLGLDPVFFQLGVVDKLHGWGDWFLRIFVVPVKFSLCAHQVHNGFPNVCFIYR